MRRCLVCRVPIATGSRCSECQRARWRANNRRRDPLARKVYGSTEYAAARRVALDGATRCATCGGHVSAVGKLTAGHVRPIGEAPGLAVDPGNLAPQCRSCQQVDVHARRRESTEARRREHEARNRAPAKSSGASPAADPSAPSARFVRVWEPADGR